MRTEQKTVDAVREEHAQRSSRYESPRVEKSRRLTDVTGQGAVVPSGAPAPVPPG